MLYFSDTFNKDQLSEHQDTQLVVNTLNHLEEMTILHSDQGSTYTSK